MLYRSEPNTLCFKAYYNPILRGFKPFFRPPVQRELTHIKCYRGWEVDEGSADTLTPIRGYPNSEPESVRQTRGPGPHSRPLPARRSAAQAAHPRRVLRLVRVSSQSRAAALEPAAAHDSAQAQRAPNPLRSGRGAAGAQARLAGQRPVVRQTPQGGAARVAGTSRAARRAAARSFQEKTVRGSADLITAQEIRPGFDHRNHLPLKSKSFLRHPSNLKFGQDFQLRLNQRFLKARHGARHGRRFSLVNFAGRIRSFGLALQREMGVSCVPMPSKRRVTGICDARRGRQRTPSTENDTRTIKAAVITASARQRALSRTHIGHAPLRIHFASRAFWLP